MAKIQLTVAGIYFSEEIDVPDEQIASEKGVRVLDLMRLARRQTNLDYRLEMEGNTPEEKSMAIIQNTLPDGFKSRSDRNRKPGVYGINERREGERVAAWQYYIERPTPPTSAVAFELISRTKGTAFKTPGVSEKLQDGDKVIWRCVSILLSPSGPIVDE
jgi:hypothetical protein